ncbi:MAG: Crp/Fnr family transcriptional regulator, partial [Actinomycetes bacterium]
PLPPATTTHQTGPMTATYRPPAGETVLTEGQPVTFATMRPVNDLDLLRDVNLFDQFDEDDHRRIADAAETLELVRGDVVFEEGAEADACYVVTDGRIAISNKSIDGRESMVALMERGDLFGEMGLFDGLGRSAEARALEGSSLIRLPYEVLRAILEGRPDLLWAVVRLLSQRIRSTDEALADSFFLDVTGRTAKHLLEIAGDDDEFELPITQEELAGLVGASRERVNKAIASFLRLGWLGHADGTYQVLNRRELEIRSQ